MAVVDVYLGAFQLFGSGNCQVAECRTEYQPHGHGLFGVIDCDPSHFVVIAGCCGSIFVFAESYRFRGMSVAVEFPWLAGNFKICIAAFRVYGEFKVLLGVGQEEFAEFYAVGLA